MHSSIDCLTQLLEEQNIQPHEIESIKVYIEGFAEQPAWLTRDITNLTDAQFSTAHSMAVAAHRPATARAWQDPKLVFSRSVMDLMAKVKTEVHPNYAQLLAANRASRPAHVELRARGQDFVVEKQYPKGSPSPDASTFMRDEELQKKFRDNAHGTLSVSATEQAIETIMTLEKLTDTGQLMRLLAGGAA
jgi:2-methylcitrate dehydratase PrpD